MVILAYAVFTGTLLFGSNRINRCVYTTNNFNFQVKIWFQNRRAKERKQMKKRDELIHKEKLEVAATLQAAASAASNVHHPFTFPHPAVMSAHLP